jgi:hypothetical protein
MGEGRICELGVSGREVSSAACGSSRAPLPPADPEARQIQITLAQSRPRYVSPDLEFAVWTATVGESREGEPVTVTGPLGHKQDAYRRRTHSPGSA